MIDREPDQVDRGNLLALFLLAIVAAGVIVACLGWGASVVSPPGL